jgi:hypothetical protein
LAQDVLELVLDVGSLLYRTIRNEVVPAPFLVHPVLYECLVSFQQSQVVPVVVLEVTPGAVRLILRIPGANEDLRHVQHRNDRRDFQNAVVLG